MVLGAPLWSPAAPQFAQGFPSKLLQNTSHKGLLRGNIIVVSRASGECLRRMAIKEIAGNIASHAVQGVGLTLARLLSCRYTNMFYNHDGYEGQ